MPRKIMFLIALMAMLSSCKKHVVKVVVSSTCNVNRLLELNVGNYDLKVVVKANTEGTVPHFDTAVIYYNVEDTFEVSVRQIDQECFEKKSFTFGRNNKTLVLVSVCKNQAKGSDTIGCNTSIVQLDYDSKFQ